MTARISCGVCGCAIDVFNVKPHKCIPKEKLVSELTVTEFKAMMEKGAKDDGIN